MPPETIGLLEISTVTTGSSNTIDALNEGLYPFFDRSQVVKRSNKFLFDTEAVIVPGEGMDFIPRFVSGKFDLHQRAYAVIPKENIDGRYLYYAIMHKRRHFSQVATGSTVKSLRLKSFELMEIPYFDKVSQLKISKILSSFDYEIDKLRCINDNL
ncbi:MAG: restriction endonuclease subunit S, partial [Gudongella sp.]|nr:restriction endonuclease subunit S [Gudongella sp.]